MHTLHHHDLFIILLTAPVDMVNIPLFTVVLYIQTVVVGDFWTINNRDEEFVLGFHMNFFHLSTFCFTEFQELNIAELGDDGFVPTQLEPWLDKHLGYASAKWKAPKNLAAHRSRVIVTGFLKPSYSGNRLGGHL